MLSLFTGMQYTCSRILCLLLFFQCPLARASRYSTNQNSSMIGKEAISKKRKSFRSPKPRRSGAHDKDSSFRDMRQGRLVGLNETHVKVLRNANEKSKKESKYVLDQLLKKINQIGYSQEDLNQVLLLVRKKAVITINFVPQKEYTNRSGETLSVLESFLNDPMYRNQYETKISHGELHLAYGGKRDSWELKNFDGIYQENGLIPEERPRYGTLHFDEAQTIVDSVPFGNCYFVLKPSVVDRSTYTATDSAAADSSSCLLYTSPSPRDATLSRMPSSA